MWLNFWLQNIHFAVEIFVGLASFTAAWLFIDTWGIKPDTKTFFRSVGFLFIAVWAGLNATNDSSFFFVLAESVTQIFGLTLLFISFMTDRVPQIPHYSDDLEDINSPPLPIPEAPTTAVPPITALSIAALPMLPVGFKSVLLIAQPVVATLLLTGSSIIIVFQVVKGIVKEWRPLAAAFILFTLSQAVTIGYLWQNTSNVVLSQTFAQYGLVWIAEHLLKLAAFFVLGAWSWNYIRFRIRPQLFVTYVGVVFVSFVITTIVFTTLLFRNVEQDQLAQLKINVQTVEYAIERLANESILAAKSVAGSSSVISALESDDTEKLYTVTNRLMLENNSDFLTIIDAGGDVIMRADDKSKLGDNLSQHPLVLRAFEGRFVSTISQEPGLNAATMLIQAVAPLVSEQGKTLGVVLTGYILDNAFLDGVKKVTGLEVTVFADNQRTATTINTPGSSSRNLGLIETDTRITSTVLEKGETYTGAATILTIPYYTAYSPVNDINNATIGMLSVARPQRDVLDGINNTIRYTFMASIILMFISLFPTYFLANYISRHQKA